MGLCSFIFSWWAPKDRCVMKERVMPLKVSWRSSKVVDFGTNRKRSCGFLLVFNSNLGRILHRFGDTAAYRSKNRKNRQFEPTPLLQIALAGGELLRIFRPVVSPGEWNHGTIRRWRNHDASCFRFDTIPAVTDRRTDRQTDTSLSQRPALRIASRG